jgi:hypothetical protein
VCKPGCATHRLALPDFVGAASAAGFAASFLCKERTGRMKSLAISSRGKARKTLAAEAAPTKAVQLEGPI